MAATPCRRHAGFGPGRLLGGQHEGLRGARARGMLVSGTSGAGHTLWMSGALHRVHTRPPTFPGDLARGTSQHRMTPRGFQEGFSAEGAWMMGLF